MLIALHVVVGGLLVATIGMASWFLMRLAISWIACCSSVRK